MALLRVEVPKCVRPAEGLVDVGWLPIDEMGVPPCADGHKKTGTVRGDGRTGGRGRDPGGSDDDARANRWGRTKTGLWGKSYRLDSAVEINVVVTVRREIGWELDASDDGVCARIQCTAIFKHLWIYELDSFNA